MSNKYCRAKNPATCRTHGERVRTDLTNMSSVISARPLDSLTYDNAINLLNRHGSYGEDAMRLATQTIRHAFDEQSRYNTLDAYKVSGALTHAVTEAKGQLARHQFDFSTYPGESLAAGPRTPASSKGWYDRSVWLREHGVTEESPDTVFGTTYVYCSSHLRAHAAGWCTVRIVDKAPLNGATQEEATDEARAKNFRIFGDPEPEPEPKRGPAPLYGVEHTRAVDNERWRKTLPAEQKEELMRLVRRAKKKDVLLTIENYRQSHEQVDA